MEYCVWEEYCYMRPAFLTVRQSSLTNKGGRIRPRVGGVGGGRWDWGEGGRGVAALILYSVSSVCPHPQGVFTPSQPTMESIKYIFLCYKVITYNVRLLI